MNNGGDWRALYPFASNWLPMEGGRLHYVDQGQGKPLLMVHGNPTWSFYFRELISGLSPTRRVVAVDHMGCGLSDKPQDYPYCLERHIENLAALIEHLDLREAALLVHDWGGAIGLGAALRSQPRFERLLLLNTGAFPPPYVPWRIRACRVPWLGTLAMRGGNLFARAAVTMAMHEHALSPAVRAGLLAPYDNWDHRIAIDRFVQDIPLTRRHPTWPVLEQIERDLPQLADRPTTLIWGMKDWCFTPVCLDRLRRLLPNGETFRLSNAGHYVVEDASQEVLEIVRDQLA